jgi:glutamate/tyrosine decarboxylase-like PLP-dependent enzyme
LENTVDKDRILNLLAKLNPRWVAVLEKRLRAIPAVAQEIDLETQSLTAELETSLKPYQANFPSHDRLPSHGRPRGEILREMQALRDLEEARWREGFVSGAVYHGDYAHIEFLNQAYAINSQANPLHADVWPSISKYEAEIIAMTGRMLGGDSIRDGQACGTVTSGGTESILLAMKTYRDWARETRGITHPEMVLPVTAHAAFDKAAQYFRIRQVRIPIDAQYKADLPAARRAISRNTVVVVGSAPSFPHGAIDPIAELSELARERGTGFHTDACLGGFLLPWAEKLGYAVPPFDFRLPGVTSISADTHKFGYAAKGTSVILYRRPELRHFQYYTTTEWPGGLYFSPTFAGSRPGALSAACWAAMLSLGEEGYLEAARKILETAATIRTAIDAIPDLYVLGDPLFVIAFASDTLDIYQVMDRMSRRGWSLNGLHKPSCVHLCITLRHTQAGIAERFIADLHASVEETRQNPEEKTGMAPVYGLAASLPLRSVVSDILKKYMDVFYKV